MDYIINNHPLDLHVVWQNVWLSAQLLDNSHMPDIVVELLVASMYLIPAPYRPPQMPQIAFLRLLENFARGHWNTDPVIVNFNDEMSKDEIIAVETLFGSSRDSLPPLLKLIGTCSQNL